MEKSNFEQIEKYLDGSLSAAERRQFEKELAKDAALRRAVDFQRGMESVLAKKSEDDLRKNLADLREKYSVTKSKSGKSWLWALLLLVFVSGAFWYFSGREIEVVSSETKESDVQKTEPVIMDSIQEEATKESTEKKEEKEQLIPEKTEQKEQTKPKKEKKKPLMIAANFEPNELLENRLSGLRGGDFEMENFSQRLSLRKDGAKLQFSGSYTTNKNPVEQEINWYLFTNKKADYENFQPFASGILSFEKEEDHYQFSVQKQLPFAAGLYYLQIENIDGEVLYLNKLEVR